ncbi:MAG TPA: beta-hydroxyacyl-ACP dehydratase [Chryseolinea sp.]
MKEVETLIPHRDPFLYVDKIVSATAEEIVGTKVFSDADQFLRGSFPGFHFVPGTILIEALAQCGGAGIKKLNLADGFFGFANIENASFFKGVLYGKEFTMVIRNIKIAERYIKQSGVGYTDGDRCVELTWTCVKFQ